MVLALQRMGLDVDDLKDAFSDIAATGAAIASRNAPRLTGALAADIRGNRAKSKAVVTAGRVSVPYAGPINYGWAAHGITGAYFMQQADAELQPYALRMLEQNINRKIAEKGLR